MVFVMIIEDEDEWSRLEEYLKASDEMSDAQRKLREDARLRLSNLTKGDIPSDTTDIAAKFKAFMESKT
jgi:hypothetical protein